MEEPGVTGGPGSGKSRAARAVACLYHDLGLLRWRGLLAYAAGLGAEWPFVAQPDYTGPLVKTLGGADISWLVGWFAATLVYLLLGALVPGTTARRGRPIAAGAR